MSTLIFSCYLAIAHAHHHDAKLFQIVTPSGSKSYVLTVVQTAWVKSPLDLPTPVRRAIQKSNALIFAHDFWTPRESTTPAAGDPSRMWIDVDVRDGLSARARRVLGRLDVPPPARLRWPRPGVILAQCLDALNRIQGDRGGRFVMPREADVPEDLTCLAESILGSGRHLPEEIKRARAEASDGQVSIERAVLWVGRRAGLEAEAVSSESDIESAIATLLETVSIADLDRALEHIGEELDADRITDDFRRNVLIALHEAANARFFRISRNALLRLRETGIEARLRGFERFRERVVVQGKTIAEALLERVWRGGAFVVLDLGIFEGEGAHAGFHRRLLTHDLDVIPLEINCEGAFH